MNKREFVDAVRISVEDSSVTGMIESLIRPAGRRPASELKSLSEWYNQLSMMDRQYVEQVISKTANHAVFNFFCVLDGLKGVEDRADKGTLEFRYKNEGVDVHLNDWDSEFLHDIFNER